MRNWLKRQCTEHTEAVSKPNVSPLVCLFVQTTSDDTGWLVTVDQYFVTEVDYIIDTVNVRLQENPDRKFICTLAL